MGKFIAVISALAIGIILSNEAIPQVHRPDLSDFTKKEATLYKYIKNNPEKVTLVRQVLIGKKWLRLFRVETPKGNVYILRGYKLNWVRKKGNTVIYDGLAGVLYYFKGKTIYKTYHRPVIINGQVRFHGVKRYLIHKREEPLPEKLERLKDILLGGD